MAVMRRQCIGILSVRKNRRAVSFILRSAQQEEALDRIWYALKRWQLVSQQIVLFLTMACSSINRRCFTR
ncbi:unnamed protein product [Spirodela intermedia]|uniref:Uncharacterized protein n=1 Tax=Spirodela intermedia TaxID=51605 RepID=A0A7I8LLB8_SPIIN|nr:unnamed protein product [Spirodela intermedia]